MVVTKASRATLAQVAHLAGVSKATASKVLNQRPDVAAPTRERVERVIDELGYVPSTGPRGSDGLRKVNVVFDTLVNVYSVQVLDGVVTAARDQGLEVLVDKLDLEAEDGGPLSDAWLRRVAAHRRAGVIVVTSELTEHQRELMRRLELSVVVIDPLDPLDDEVVSVGSTNYAGGVQATRHLLELGHRRIAFAGGPSASAASRERLQGFLSAMSSASVEVAPELVRDGDFTFLAGLEMAATFLDRPDPPTAVFAACDAAALGVLEAARRRRLHVPEDLSVVGFDDTYAALSTAPLLTTVRQPIIDMGRVALRTLLQQARGERADSHHVQLSTRLIVRDSTAPPMSSGR